MPETLAIIVNGKVADAAPNDGAHHAVVEARRAEGIAAAVARRASLVRTQ